MHGQKKRRKRSMEGETNIDGVSLFWALRSEPQWSSEHGHEGMTIEVHRVDGSFRKLILQYPIPKGRGRSVDGLKYSSGPFYPLRPNLSAKEVERDIRSAIAGGWDMNSRGRTFVFQVLGESEVLPSLEKFQKRHSRNG